jgi:hypothetical protein
MCAGALQEDIGEILFFGRESWAENGGRIIWQRLRMNNGEDMEYKRP